KTCRRYYDQHLNRFVDKKTGKTLPFNLVQDHIKNYLDDKGHQAAFNAYIDRLMDKANIVGL
ncbi:MAG: peptidylprolyl isomerase, partial [Proteobacteria bacterium]|nr:peptidylprolyl isomerase [Pseudomonadota bacterium]